MRYSLSTLISHSDFIPYHSHCHTQLLHIAWLQGLVSGHNRARKRFGIIDFDTGNNFAKYLQHRSNSRKAQVMHLFVS